MLKGAKTKKVFDLDRSRIIKNFYLNKQQELKLNIFLEELINHNRHTNLVGKSTLVNPWQSHILDCIQISKFIKNKKSTILDMGTGPGLPGLILAIVGYKKVSLVDSNNKKINFIKNIIKKLDIKVEVFLNRIEKINNKKYNYLTSRALASLSKLFSYSQNFINKDTVLIFLKGKSVNDEIVEAKQKWDFDSYIKQSRSDERGKILIIKNLTLK